MVHHRGLTDDSFLQTSNVGGWIERFRWKCLGILEGVAAVFALNNDVFVRVRQGRRYFLLITPFVTQFLDVVVYYVGGCVMYLRKNAGALKPSLVIDPMGLKEPSPAPGPADPPASPEAMFFYLKIFLLVALSQKLLCKWRQIRKCEPELTTYGGQSIFGWLLTYVPRSWITLFAVSTDDFEKRYLEPLCCYLLGRLVIGPLIDPLIGSLIQWSAIAQFVRSYVIRLRFQLDLDNIEDSHARVSHTFSKIVAIATPAGMTMVLPR